MSVPVFITCRDRVACLQLLVARLESMSGIGPIVLVDNDSTWPPLVEYLAKTQHEVVRLGANLGHRAVWVADVLPELRRAGPFVVTDPDVVPDEGCPDDVIDHLLSLLEGDARLVKAGLGLRLDDLPDGIARTEDVRDWESQFWEQEVSPGVFAADVDTTFAVYRAGAGPEHGPAVRTGGPYLARHLPWYDDPASPDAEEVFYRARARVDATNWHLRQLQPPLAAALARRRRVLRGLPDHPLLDAWASEPELVDETSFTPWAVAGWESWNAMSAERDFCEFVGSLVRMLQPELVVETGVGQGYTTRRVAAGLVAGVQLCFESDPELREALSALPFFHVDGHRLSPAATPSAEEFSGAHVTLLDSDPPGRYAELALWRESATAGSVLVVHDCGNGHSEDTPHGQLRRMVEELDVPGVFLRNPRGAFVGIHPGRVGPSALQEALTRAEDAAAAATRELAAVRSTLSWRLTRPLRRVQQARRSARGRV